MREILSGLSGKKKNSSKHLFQDLTPGSLSPELQYLEDVMFA